MGTVHIKLSGSKAARFEEIKRELGRELGYRPTNPEIVGLFMTHFVADDGRLEDHWPPAR